MQNGSIKVLLVEDNPGDARLIQEMLSETVENPFDVFHVERLSAGLERISQGGIDVVLLDLSLPDSHGWDTFTQLYDRAPQIAIVVMTALDDESLGTRAVREGAQDYLVKGQVEGSLLARAVRYAAERNRAEEALRNAQRELERRVEERTEELSETNRKLQTEIAEHKRTEEELKALHTQLQEANRGLTLAYAQMRDQKDRLGTLLYREELGFLIDREGHILGVTERAMETTGRSRIGLLESSIVDLVDDESISDLRRGMTQVWIGMSYWIPLRLMGKGKSPKVFEAKLMRINMEQEKWLLVLMREEINEGDSDT